MSKQQETHESQPKAAEVQGSNDEQFKAAEAEQQADKNLFPESKLDQVALEKAGDAAEARYDAITYWNTVYDRLKELKLDYEHTENAPIRGSKLWVLLASINTAEE